MVDVHTKAVRSFNMSRIKSRDTKPELKVRKYLFTNGFRYRVNVKKLPGTPDIVLPKYKTVIFVHGCFWHGHKNCKYFVAPKTRTKWWMEKINKNKINDDKHRDNLIKLGYKVIILWECKLKSLICEKTFNNISKKILG